MSVMVVCRDGYSRVCKQTMHLRSAYISCTEHCSKASSRGYITVVIPRVVVPKFESLGGQFRTDIPVMVEKVETFGY